MQVSCTKAALMHTNAVNAVNVFSGQIERNWGVCHKPPTLSTSAPVAAPTFDIPHIITVWFSS